MSRTATLIVHRDGTDTPTTCAQVRVRVVSVHGPVRMVQLMGPLRAGEYILADDGQMTIEDSDTGGR